MGKPGKRHFAEEFKRQIVDKYNSGTSFAQIEKEFSIPKYTVVRWVEKFTARELKSNGHAHHSNGHAKAPTAVMTSEQLADTRDKVIFRLKLKIADLTMKIERLEAELNNKRRYEDQQLYGAMPLDPDLLR
jgi:transposase-like protein